MKYQDNYEKNFFSKKAFAEEIEDRENHSERIRVKNDNIKFYELSINNGRIYASRICKDESEEDVDKTIIQKQFLMAPFGELNGIPGEIWIDTIKFGSGMAVSVENIETGQQNLWYPISGISKLSLHNRSGVSFTGEIRQEFSKLALAKLYEDFIRMKGGCASTAIIVYGKMQALMSSRYSPISQNDVFSWVENKIAADFQHTTFAEGYVSHKKSNASWLYKAEEDDTNIGITVADSSTGYSGVVIVPFVKSEDVGVHFADSAWYSRHMSITPEDIEEGINAIYLESENIAKKLLETKYIHVENPEFFADNVFEALNRMAGRMHSAKLVDEFKQFVDRELQSCIDVPFTITVWDIVKIFWKIPNAAQSDSYKMNLQKTVSRILSLDYSKYDVQKYLK